MQETVFDIRKIFELLPHRFPFLLVDRVTSLIEAPAGTRVGAKAEGIKNVTFNEPYFPGHFPDMPVMPGVLQIEAMAQLAAISFYREGDPPMNFLIAGVQDARFRKPVVPGDQLKISSSIVKERGPIFIVATQCHVDGELVAEATIMAHVSPRDQGGPK
jgi:3-hydroxyacyl-[acyl-carrier-protein] dehydratase